MKKTVSPKRSHRKSGTQPENDIQHAPSPMRYHLVFSGDIAPGLQIEDVKKRVAALFKIPVTQCDDMFTGKVVTIKKNLDKAAADRHKLAFETTGAICRIEKTIPNTQKHPIQKPLSSPSRLSPPDKAAKPTTDQESLPVCPKCNYQARTPEDPLITGMAGMGECPRCGIIVSKYKGAAAKKAERENPETLLRTKIIVTVLRRFKPLMSRTKTSVSITPDIPKKLGPKIEKHCASELEEQLVAIIEGIAGLFLAFGIKNIMYYNTAASTQPGFGLLTLDEFEHVDISRNEDEVVLGQKRIFSGPYLRPGILHLVLKNIQYMVSESRGEYSDAILEVLASKGPLDGFFLSPGIPEERLASARSRCRVPEYENVLGIAEGTRNTGFQCCLVFGSDGIYYRTMNIKQDEPGILFYHEFNEGTFKTSSSDSIGLGANERLCCSEFNCGKAFLFDLLRSCKDAVLKDGVVNDDFFLHDDESRFPGTLSEINEHYPGATPPIPASLELGYGILNKNILISAGEEQLLIWFEKDIEWSQAVAGLLHPSIFMSIPYSAVSFFQKKLPEAKVGDLIFSMAAHAMGAEEFTKPNTQLAVQFRFPIPFQVQTKQRTNVVNRYNVITDLSFRWLTEFVLIISPHSWDSVGTEMLKNMRSKISIGSKGPECPACGSQTLIKDKSWDEKEKNMSPQVPIICTTCDSLFVLDFRFGRIHPRS